MKVAALAINLIMLCISYTKTAYSIGTMHYQESRWQLLHSRLVIPSGPLFIDNSIYAGTQLRGVVKSVNGSDWQSINNGLDNSGIDAIAGDTKNLYVGVGSCQGIYKSTDKGDHWQIFNNSLPNGCITEIFLNGKDLYVSPNNYGLYKSTNGGPWQLFNQGLNNNEVLSYLAYKDRLYVGTDDGIFYQNKESESPWKRLGTGLSRIAITALAIDNTGIMYAGANNGLFKSTDNGITWQTFDNGLVGKALRISKILSKQNFLYVGTEDGVFRRSDYKANWQKFNTGINSSVLNLVSNKDKIYAACVNGVFIRKAANNYAFDILGTTKNDLHPGKTYFFFKDGTYMQLNDTTNTMDKGYPQSTSQWGMSTTHTKIISGIIKYSRHPGKTYFFFNDGTYTRFDDANNTMDPGYPYSTASEWGMSTTQAKTISGIIKDSRHPDKTYFFFKDGTYMRFDDATDTMDPGYPYSTASQWGMSTKQSKNISGIMKYSHRPDKIYFFLNDGTYMRFNDITDTMEADYPKSTAQWWTLNNE